MHAALPLALIVLLSACATPRSRIRRRQAAFDAYPAAVQERIRAGEVEVGFTQEQAELAMGAPDRKFTRKTASATQDVWGYGAESARPRLGLNFGMGSFGGGGSYSGGVGVESEAGLDERARLVFEGGLLVSVERLKD